MQLATTSAFLQWAQKRGVVPNAPYSYPARDYDNLCLKNEESSRYWIISRQTEENNEREVWIYYVSAALAALDDWQTCGLFKRERGWSFSHRDPWAEESLTSLGVPPNYDGGLLFDRRDYDTLFGIVLTLSAFGGNIAFAVFVVPDHGRQMLCFDHALGVVGHFANGCARERYTNRLAAKSIYLPTNPPTGFFGRPDWMEPKLDADV